MPTAEQMPTSEQMAGAVHAYIDRFNARDLEGLLALFTDDATVEDPIGTPPKVGKAAIREFYTMSIGTGAELHLDGPVCPTGSDYVAYVMHVIVPLEQKLRFDVIETFRIDEAGKIAEMRAYFGPSNIRPV